MAVLGMSSTGPLTDYVRDGTFPATDGDNRDARPSSIPTVEAASSPFNSSLDTVAGIELSTDAIRSATANAELNNLPPNRCTFLAGDASDIFATSGPPPRERTAVIVDPPRKVCNTKFVEQLLAFGAGTVMYVSCNVHTQARV